MADSIKQIQEQVNALASAHEDGIDTVAAAIQDLYLVLDHLTTELRAADRTITALKYILIQEKVIDEKRLDALSAKISDLYRQKAEKIEIDKKKPTAVNMQDELKLIHESAKEAAESPYDADAFIFGS